MEIFLFPLFLLSLYYNNQDMQRGKLKNENILSHILGGNSIITFESTLTNNWFTYKINKCKNDETLFFVSVLTGPVNTTNYTYIGTYKIGRGFFHSKKSKITCDAISVVTFNWVVNHINSPKLNLINFYHEGHCSKCGKKLTTPESIQNGYGPICESYMNNLNKKLYRY